MKKFIALFIAAALVFTMLAGCEKERDTKGYAMYTPNFGITKDMLSYAFNVEYISFITANSDKLSDYKLDTSSPLSGQSCPITSGTWYDYFMDAAKDKLTQILVISEKAKKDGKTLYANGVKALDASLDSMKELANEKGLSFSEYIKKNFGESVNESTVKNCIENELLVTQYFNEFVKTLDESETTLDKYYNNHKKTFSTVDYLYFAVPADKDSAINDSGFNTATALKNSKSEKEFKKIAKTYLYNYYIEKYGSKSESKVTKAVTKEIEKITVTNAAYNSSQGACRWAFENGRKAGDTTLINDSDNGFYHVYYLISPPSREEFKTVNMREILFNNETYGSSAAAKKQAQECLKTLKESNYSDECFLLVSKQFSDDIGTREAGGLYSKIKKGSLQNSEDIENWLFDPVRKIGDCKIIETKGTGWNIVYLDSFSDAAWVDSVRKGYEAAKFRIYIENLSDSYMVYENNNIIYQTKETEQ